MKLVRVDGVKNFYLDADHDPPVGYYCFAGQLCSLIPEKHAEYPYWHVWREDGVVIKLYCHLAVAQTLIPNENHLPVVNHKDGDKHNYSVGNLEWVTQRANVLHAHRHDLIPKTTPSRKVRQICEMIRDGYCNKAIGETVGVSGAVVCNIRHGRRHRQVLDEIMQNQ